MIVDTPPIECYVKKSHLSSEFTLTSEDETIFGILIAIRFIRNRAPLFIVYFPSIGAIYDKVNQNAIFNQKDLDYDGEIRLEDVGWWDCLSTKWQLIELKFLKNNDIEMTNRRGQKMSGIYLFTCDPQEPQHGNDYGESETWHEHKTKTFFFDYETGVLCCTPNNKMRVFMSSLSKEEPDDASWLRVYREEPEDMSHEVTQFLGDTDKFMY